MASRSALPSFTPLLRRAAGAPSISIPIRTTPSTWLPGASAVARPTWRFHPALASSSPSARFSHTIPQPPQTKPTPAASSESSQEASSSAESSATDTDKPAKSRVEQQPHYRLTFTCSPCDTQSTHNISKQGYHHGSVLVTCPSCRNRHVISDHLKIFHDRSVTVEDLLREKGQLVKKGTLGEEGDIEFWEDDVGANAGQDFKLAGQGKGQ